MKRRMFISLIGATAAAWPLMARAQQSSNRIPFVGVLWHAGSAEEEDVYLSVLVKAFNDLGYVEGENIHLDHNPSADNVSSGVLTQHKWLAYNEQVDRLNAIRVPMRGRRTGSPIGRERAGLRLRGRVKPSQSPNKCRNGAWQTASRTGVSPCVGLRAFLTWIKDADCDLLFAKPLRRTQQK